MSVTGYIYLREREELSRLQFAENISMTFEMYKAC